MSSVFFVTGSSRGLGRHIAERALDAGHRVVATARDPRALDDLVARYGDRVHVEPLDVTDAAAAEAAVAAGVAAFGRIDVVVNNAGQGDRVSLEDTTLDVFRRQIETNFLGTVYVTKAAIPVLRGQGGGRIIQISSVGGRVGSPGMTAYQSAKWAVGGFTEALAAEVAPLGIKLTVLEPGGMRTDWGGASMTGSAPANSNSASISWTGCQPVSTQTLLIARALRSGAAARPPRRSCRAPKKPVRSFPPAGAPAHPSEPQPDLFD